MENEVDFPILFDQLVVFSPCRHVNERRKLAGQQSKRNAAQ